VTEVTLWSGPYHGARVQVSEAYEHGHSDWNGSRYHYVRSEEYPDFSVFSHWEEIPLEIGPEIEYRTRRGRSWFSILELGREYALVEYRSGKRCHVRRERIDMLSRRRAVPA
jgi:hypothetical protein